MKHQIAVCILAIFFVLSGSFHPIFNPLTAQNRLEPVSSPEPPAEASRSIEIPNDKAAELRALYQTLIEAEHARDLARAIAEAKEQAWRAEYNAYVGTQYKLARELAVPQGWVLNVEKMRFQSPENGTQDTLK